MKRAGVVAVAVAMAIGPFALEPPAMAAGSKCDLTNAELEALGYTVVGGTTAGDDEIIGSAANEVLRGGDGFDVLKGWDGNDVVCGGNGHDGLHGGDGDDDMSGGAGRDLLVGKLGVDTLYGNGETDGLFGSDGNDTLDSSGDSATDYVSGNFGTDILVTDATDQSYQDFQDYVGCPSDDWQILQIGLFLPSRFEVPGVGGNTDDEETNSYCLTVTGKISEGPFNPGDGDHVFNLKRASDGRIFHVEFMPRDYGRFPGLEDVARDGRTVEVRGMHVFEHEDDGSLKREIHPTFRVRYKKTDGAWSEYFFSGVRHAGSPWKLNPDGNEATGRYCWKADGDACTAWDGKDFD